MELIPDTIRRYRGLFGDDPEIVVTAPGRVNLIGEHTDYNSGFVLPVAIDRKIIIAAGRKEDSVLTMHTVDFQLSVKASLSDLHYDGTQLWGNFPKGVAHVFQQRGYKLSGANLCIRGDIPIGAGLSSSAAIEVASSIAFNQLNNLGIPTIELIKLAQRAETEFVGVHCGIMDQFVCVMGQKSHALFLDCDSLTYEHIPCPAGVRLIICDTGLRRELAHSEYNRRQDECREAIQQLSQEKRSIKSLRHVTMKEFEANEKSLSPIPRKRARHVITENNRVLRSVEAMKNHDLKELGKLMIESHMSLRNNFEVSCKELDAVVDVAVESEGVYGARMTGAGFGGSAICIVDEDKIDDLVERLRTEYPKLAGRSLTIYVASTGDGASIINPRESMEPVSIAHAAS